MNARDECDCCGDLGKYIAGLRRVLCAECLYELTTGKIPPLANSHDGDGLDDRYDYERWLAEGRWHNAVRAMEG